MEEIWKDIPWWEWYYQASNLGKIKSLARKKWFIFWKEKILKNFIKRNWYAKVNLSISDIDKSFYVHRLVAQTFITNIENSPCVNHINWIRNDNRIENLEWVTYSENTRHSFDILWNKSLFQTNHPSKWKFWKNHFNSKKVNQYDLDWNFIKTRNCWMDIQRELLINRSSIWKCCRWEQETSYWFIWKFTN